MDCFPLGHCLTPIKVGPCRGSFPRWHYNAASSKCEKFLFGGCKANSNNYLSEKECLDACENTKGNANYIDLSVCGGENLYGFMLVELFNPQYAADL